PLFVEVQVDPVIVKGHGGTIKYQEQAPIVLGPCMLSFDLSWDDFLTLLAKQVYAKSPVCLVVDTMVWQFSVSQTVKVDSLPLTSEEGFEYMISHLKASSLRAAGNLFIKM
ncbi:hypothetical protein BKA82DRAFT_3932596, partial [Pisolithus tinctorius]